MYLLSLILLCYYVNISFSCNDVTTEGITCPTHSKPTRRVIPDSPLERTLTPDLPGCKRNPRSTTRVCEEHTLLEPLIRASLRKYNINGHTITDIKVQPMKVLNTVIYKLHFKMIIGTEQQDSCKLELLKSGETSMEYLSGYCLPSQTSWGKDIGSLLPGKKAPQNSID